MQSETITQALTAVCREIDRVDACMLLQHVLNVNHAFLLTYPDHVLIPQQTTEFFCLAKQRIGGTPIAYLTGERAFYDLNFKVTEAVLIPRPETELLVEWALKLIPVDQPRKILDLGTGSGAIAITIAKHRPQSQVTAVDLSADALAVCRWNTKNLRVNNLHLIAGNWFDELSGERFDLIVSNPPYVAESDPHLKQGDLRFEPQIALSAGDNGLACIGHIINAAPRHLVKSGWLLLEHGYDQAAACRRLLAHRDFSNICCYPDLAGIMRVSGGQMNASVSI
ncbi:peptide chain release factor N(5)-glutamine methyltransferase [Nitrosomonas sp. Nm166]|uniref:peptide chain release factor N(5)-glutamine methyltransferase n=1 Tax=Nitrosomonas sp. Nm166 TaxID=1881054 RepID=UPI0008E043E2|nr:peptide chain release factor N(5)-glutamine methyltransferase [Nitrosomonas sp. Nm166]SFF00411.1 release factor glutamine methyltransferase [Nitrosomonas sp. Nm166]